MEGGGGEGWNIRATSLAPVAEEEEEEEEEPGMRTLVGSCKKHLVRGSYRAQRHPQIDRDVVPHLWPLRTNVLALRPLVAVDGDEEWMHG